MNPITSIEIVFNPGGSMKLHLGDILILDSPLEAHNHRDISQFVPLAILAVGFFASKIYFTMLGLDAFQYGISKYTKKGLVLLNRRGKEIKMPEKHIVRFFREFARRRNSDIIDGIPLYLRTLITSTSQLKHSSGCKIGKRLINMVEWPDRSLTTWAKKHLCIPFQFVPRIEHIESRHEMIDAMIKLGTCQAKGRLKSNKTPTKSLHTTLDTLPNVEDHEVRVNPEGAEPTWHALRPRAPLRDYHYGRYEETEPIQHNVDVGQQEKMVIENIGEAPFELVVNNNGEPEHIVRDDQGERSVLYRNPNGRFVSQPQDIVESGRAESLWGPDPAINEDDPDEIR
jgi:hypothetical protein